ncbi:hypothetical protein EPN87_04110 [archaeon]|nr:MAG: hypothetical protein EPN87_04110 [archaeon]
MEHQQLDYRTIKGMLDILTETLQLPQRFEEVKASNSSSVSYVGIEPLKTSADVNFCSLDRFYSAGSDIMDLGLPQQVYLLKGLSQKMGMKFRLGSTQENFAASLSETLYKKNILNNRWVYTGEVVMCVNNNYEVSNIIDVSFVERNPPTKTVFRRDGKLLETNEIKEMTADIALGPPLQTLETPLNGYHDGFAGTLPARSDIKHKDKGKGFFSGYVLGDHESFSISCGKASGRFGFTTHVDGLFAGSNDTAIGVWTDENPRK